MAAFKSAASGSAMELIQRLSFVMLNAQASAMFIPSILHESTRLLSRVPPQSGHVPMRNIGFSTAACSRPSSELMMERYIRGIRPSYFAVFGQLAGGFFNLICGLFRNRSSSSGV